MVITDKSSGRSAEDIRSAAKSIEEVGVRIIPVSVGKEVDPKELKSASSDGTVISTSNKEDPKTIGDEIISKILEGQPLCFVVVGIHVMCTNYIQYSASYYLTCCVVCYTVLILPFVVSDKRPVPELELGFALAAASTNSHDIYELMKNAIKSIIDEYEIDRVRYGLIVFGDSASIKVNFQDSFTVEELKQFIGLTRAPRRGAALDKALEEAKKMFKAPGVRPYARKVLVVMTDKASGRGPSDIREASRQLKGDNVAVVAVAIGEESDPEELKIIEPSGPSIETDKDADPEDLGKEIMDAALKGKG